jgi:hypothetical protein
MNMFKIIKKKMLTRDFEGDVIPKSLYENLKKYNYVVGGSYALQQYTKAKWEANDIDIFINCFGYNEYLVFEMIVKSFIETNEKIKIITDFRTLDQLCKDAEKKEDAMIQERFSTKIIGTITIQYPGIDKHVQFIGISCKYNEELVDILDKMTDLPSCLSYNVSEDKRIFNVPDKYLKMGDVINNRMICPLRKKKYEERGYKFE